MFNVKYKQDGEEKFYLSKPVSSYGVALVFSLKLADKYLNKPYPNGKGFYNISDINVVEV